LVTFHGHNLRQQFYNSPKTCRGFIMADVLLSVIAVLCALTFSVSAMLLLRLRQVATSEPLTKDVIGQLLRGETEFLRRSNDDQARGVRQELGDSLKNFQDTTIKSFSALSEGVNTQVRAFVERLDAGVKIIDQQVAGIAEKLNTDIARIGVDAAQNRDALRQIVELKLDASVAKQSDDAKNLRNELNTSLQRLGSGVSATLTQLSAQQKERLEKTAQALDLLSEKNEKAHGALRQSVEARLDAIRIESATKLEKMRQTVDEKLQSILESRLGESFNRVVEQLNRVHEGLGEMKSLASNVGDLKNVLTNVKVRGTYGEVQLELLLEQFLTPDQYVKHARVKEHTSERVEFAVKLPGKGVGEEVLLAIDAKFPRENYDKLLDASEAGDTKLIESYRKQLVMQIKSSAKDICEKYINPPRTTDFAILFLPTEGLYAEVLRQCGLFEQVQRDYKVTLAGPTTLSALLNALQMGFRSLAIERRSSEVWQILGAVQNEFGKYNTVVERLAKQLTSAATSVESLGQRTRAMNRRLKSVEALPDGVSGPALLGLDNDEVAPLDHDPMPTRAGEIRSNIVLPERV
jgi:DNA recombination protein RmuC